MSWETGGKEEIEFENVLICAETNKAYKLVTEDLNYDYDGAEWFPKSQIDWVEPAQVRDRTTFYIPRWLAEKKGWV